MLGFDLYVMHVVGGGGQPGEVVHEDIELFLGLLQVILCKLFLAFLLNFKNYW